VAPPDYFVLGLVDNLPVRTAWKEAEQTDGSRADLLSETFFSALYSNASSSRRSLDDAKATLDPETPFGALLSNR
jgi:hypothetical protein